MCVTVFCSAEGQNINIPYKRGTGLVHSHKQKALTFKDISVQYKLVSSTGSLVGTTLDVQIFEELNPGSLDPTPVPLSVHSSGR